MVLALRDPTAHAEVQAIRDASARIGNPHLLDATLYTSCYPCPMCFGAVLWARIPTVYYGCTSADAAGIGFDDERFHNLFDGLEELVKIEQLERAACLEIFQRFAADPEGELY